MNGEHSLTNPAEKDEPVWSCGDDFTFVLDLMDQLSYGTSLFAPYTSLAHMVGREGRENLAKMLF